MYAGDIALLGGGLIPQVTPMSKNVEACVENSEPGLLSGSNQMSGPTMYWI
jgi:hypothetical protein